MKSEYTKVTAYITCAGKLVVFTQADFPEVGVQVPSGTVDDGENLEEAVLREAHEETGLLNLKIETFLGDKKHIFDPPDEDPVKIHRHYYHLSYPGPIDQERWQHWEMTPSEGPESQILFELFWVDIHNIPEINGAHDFLYMIIDSS